MDYVVFDVETVRSERAEAYFAQKTYEPAANLKDPAKIQASIEEKRVRDLERACLHWWLGKIICVGAYDVQEGEEIVFSGDDERKVITDFFDWVPEGATLIAKSGDFFDTPYLIGRCLALDIGVPSFLRPSRPILDVDHIFGFSQASSQRSSLADYAWGLQIDGKNGHGSEVAAMHAEGRWDDIRRYCAQDVRIAAEMLRRWTKVYEVGPARRGPVRFGAERSG